MLVLALLGMLVASCRASTPDNSPRQAGSDEPGAEQRAPAVQAVERATQAPEITDLEFGKIRVNGKAFKRDVVIENGVARKRKKGPSKADRAKHGHTPLTTKEKIPWDCKTLVVGTGMHGMLPVVEEFKQEAERRGVKLILLKTPAAVEYFLRHYGPEINAIFHITC
jgi:hypothetical protein